MNKRPRSSFWLRGFLLHLPQNRHGYLFLGVFGPGIYIPEDSENPGHHMLTSRKYVSQRRLLLSNPPEVAAVTYPTLPQPHWPLHHQAAVSCPDFPCPHHHHNNFYCNSKLCSITNKSVHILTFPLFLVSSNLSWLFLQTVLVLKFCWGEPAH